MDVILSSRYSESNLDFFHRIEHAKGNFFYNPYDKTSPTIDIKIYQFEKIRKYNGIKRNGILLPTPYSRIKSE